MNILRKLCYDEVTKNKQVFYIIIIIIVVSFLILTPLFKVKNNCVFSYASNHQLNELIDYLFLGQLKSNKDQKIDTQELGNHSLVIIYESFIGIKHQKIVNYQVIDNEKPQIEIIVTKLSTYNVESIDFKQFVTIKDNYYKHPELTYQIDTDNKFVTYCCTDSSNNQTIAKIPLQVYKLPDDVDQSTVTFFITSKGFGGYTNKGMTYIEDTLITNKTYSLPSSYNPGLLAITKQAFNEMAQAASICDCSLRIISGFRTYNRQYTLYSKWQKLQGTAHADTHSSRPGHSEHQTGYAIDINMLKVNIFKNTKEYAWLKDNCYKYGFILRYVEGKSNETGYGYEPWHYRYVGVKLAEKLYNNGDWITLEDYFGIDSVYQNSWN